MLKVCVVAGIVGNPTASNGDDALLKETYFVHFSVLQYPRKHGIVAIMKCSSGLTGVLFYDLQSLPNDIWSIISLQL
jgi:hypothetical protein